MFSSDIYIGFKMVDVLFLQCVGFIKSVPFITIPLNNPLLRFVAGWMCSYFCFTTGEEKIYLSSFTAGICGGLLWIVCGNDYSEDCASNPLGRKPDFCIYSEYADRNAGRESDGDRRGYD